MVAIKARLAAAKAGAKLASFSSFDLLTSTYVVWREKKSSRFLTISSMYFTLFSKGSLPEGGT
jgi:hypothetical protein